MKILITAPCRQKPEIFREYLKSLHNLEKPENAQVDRFFLLHNSPELIPLIKEHPEPCMFAEYTTEDEYKSDGNRHLWTSQLVANIIKMKNGIARFALDNDYDYIFFVDTDLMLHPKTLVQLLETKKDIVAEIFWTRWDKDGQPLPNCWMYDSYHGFDHAHIAEWLRPGTYEVGQTGACILLHRSVFEKGVSYSDIYNLGFDGEDRFFCVRAACAGLKIWIDTHYPAVHLYRPELYDRYMAKGGYEAAFKAGDA